MPCNNPDSMTFHVYAYDTDGGKYHDIGKEFTITKSEAETLNVIGFPAGGRLPAEGVFNHYNVKEAMFKKCFGFEGQFTHHYQINWSRTLIEGIVSWRGCVWHIKRVT